MKSYVVLFAFLSSSSLLNIVTGIYLDTTVGLTDTNISSPGYVDGLEYGEDITREFRLTTNYPNHTLVLTIYEFELETDDKNGGCYYDSLKIYDGYNESSPVLKVICDVKPAGTTYQTTGNVVYVVFESDHTNNFKGFNIGVRSDGPTTTTNTTSTTSKTSTTTSTTASPTTSTTASPTTSTTASPTTSTTASPTTSTTASPTTSTTASPSTSTTASPTTSTTASPTTSTTASPTTSTTASPTTSTTASPTTSTTASPTTSTTASPTTSTTASPTTSTTASPTTSTTASPTTSTTASPTTSTTASPTTSTTASRTASTIPSSTTPTVTTTTVGNANTNNNNDGRSVYTRWGRNKCDGDTSVVYTGFIAGRKDSEKGGGSDTICLPSDPTWLKYKDGVDNARGYVYGSEINSYDDDGISEYPVNNQDLHCAVCLTSKRTVLMIPGRSTCYNGWTQEYQGYLMAEYHGHPSPHNHICVDSRPDFVPNGAGNDNEHILYFTEARCGSLSCPPYVEGREIACVVCSI